MDWRKILYVMPFLVIATFVTIVAVRLIGTTHQAQEQVQTDVNGIDLTDIRNSPYRSVKTELSMPDSSFKVVGMDVTPGTQLHWVLLSRGDSVSFRALIENSNVFGQIVGRKVRLGRVSYWHSMTYEGDLLIVLGIE